MICFFYGTYRFEQEWHKIELNQLLQKMKMTKNTKDTINGYVYVEKIS